MVLRPFVSLLLAAAVLVTGAAPVAAWANGSDGGNGYGTHDWILDAALAVLDGRADDWFDRTTAILATDDPDTIESPAGEPRPDHVYREAGSRGGAPHRIAAEFDLAQAAYAAGAAARASGDEPAALVAFSDASYHIGLLTHFVGDLSQPFHTANAAINKDEPHLVYERLVNALTRAPTDSPAWQSSRRTVTGIADVRRTAIAEAAYSRHWYPEVYDEIIGGGGVMTTRLTAITGRLLTRAANDLADIIWSVSQGVGAAPAPARIAVGVRWKGVRAGGTQTVRVRAWDATGTPIEGLMVDVRWPLPTGVVVKHLYTGPTGSQSRSGTVGTTPALVRLPVTATSTVRDITVSGRSSWVISPRLPDGRAGFRVGMRDATVVAGQLATAVAVARDANGVGVPNLLVTFAWDYGRTIVRESAWTDATGRATSSRRILAGTTREPIRVVARVQSGSEDHASATSLVRTD